MIFSFLSNKLRIAINKRDSIVELKRLLFSMFAFESSLFGKYSEPFFIMYDFLEKNSGKILKMKNLDSISFKRLIELSEKINGWILPYSESNPIVSNYVSALRKKHFYAQYIYLTRVQMSIVLKNAIRDGLIKIPTSEEYARMLNFLKKDKKRLMKKSAIERDPTNGELILKNE